MNRAISKSQSRDDMAKGWPIILERHVETSKGCWELPFALNERGYCKMTSLASVPYAHRVAYQNARGPIAEGMVIDHLCRNRRCCNPDHLEAVTNAENHRRGVLARLAGANVNGRPARKSALGSIFQDSRGLWIAQVKYMEGGKVRQKRRASKDRTIAEQKLAQLRAWKMEREHDES